MTRQLEALPGVAVSFLLLSLAPWAKLAGQDGLDLKRSPESGGGNAAASCPTLTRPAPPPPATVAQAQAMAMARQASDAMLVGSTEEARRLLARAAALDPSSDEVAYQLARAYEDAGQARDAVREYCRYLTLAPQPDDAAEARQRIATLSAPAGAAVPERAAVQFRTGVTYVERGQLAEAQRAFDAALAAHAPFAAAYYDRAFVHVRERRWAEAANDLERYAELAPGALDRGVAREQARVLRGAASSPSTAFTVGLLPGGAQFYTGRPTMGTLVAAAIVGAAAVALVPKDEIQTVNAVDPNGQPYSYRATVTEYPYRAAGLGTAAALLLGAAAEGLVHVLRAQDEAEEIRVASRPTVRAAAVEGARITPMIGAHGSGRATVGLRVAF